MLFTQLFESDFNGKKRLAETHDDYEDCSYCSGTGEGRYEGSSCSHCHGTGVEPSDSSDDDFDIPDDDYADSGDEESYYEKSLRSRGLGEGTGNVGNAIKSLYQKIYAAGDDEIEYFYNDSPIFAQYWDEYEGDLDSIIAEVDPGELQVILDELESYAHQAGLAEGKEDKIKQLKSDYDTAVHWSKNEKSPQKREAARQKAEKIKRHLETQYKQGVAEGDTVGMKDGRPYSDPLRRHPGNESYMTPDYLIQKYQERLAQIASGPYKRPKEVAQLKSRIAKLQGKQGVAEDESQPTKYRATVEYGPTAADAHFVTVTANSTEEAEAKVEAWCKKNGVRNPMITINGADKPVAEGNRGYFDGMPSTENDVFRIPGPDTKPATPYRGGSEPAQAHGETKYKVGDTVPVYMGSSPGVATFRPEDVVRGEIIEADPTGELHRYRIKLQNGLIATVPEKRISVAKAFLKKQGVVQGTTLKTVAKADLGKNPLKLPAGYGDVVQPQGLKDVEEARVGNRMSDIEIGSPKVVYYKGKAVGEVGLDHEASPGNGPFYMKHYLTGKDMVGYPSKKEALADLKYLVQQMDEGVTEGADERKQKALWAQITQHEQAAKKSKDLKRQHHLKMADQLRSQLKTSDNVEEDKKKDNSVKDVALQRAMSKAQAAFPTASSGLEALAKDMMQSQEKDQDEFEKIRQADREQDQLLSQISQIDQNQTQEIDDLEQENNTLKNRLKQIQSVNSRLADTLANMTGRKKEKTATGPDSISSTSTEPVLSPVKGKAKSTKTAKAAAPSAIKSTATQLAAPKADPMAAMTDRITKGDAAIINPKQSALPFEPSDNVLEPTIPQAQANPRFAAARANATDAEAKYYRDLTSRIAKDTIIDPEKAIQTHRVHEGDKETKKSEPPEADYGDDYQAMVSRVGKLAKAGPLKTVWDPVKRVYKNVPVNK